MTKVLGWISWIFAFHEFWPTLASLFPSGMLKETASVTKQTLFPQLSVPHDGPSKVERASWLDPLDPECNIKLVHSFAFGTGSRGYALLPYLGEPEFATCPFQNVPIPWPSWGLAIPRRSNQAMSCNHQKRGSKIMCGIGVQDPEMWAYAAEEFRYAPLCWSDDSRFMSFLIWTMPWYVSKHI